QGIDPDRIGVLGSILGAKYALYSAKENPRIRAIGMLDPVVWAWDEANDHEAVNTVGRPVLLVTGSGMGELTRRFAELVRRNNQNSVLSYPGATVAYLRFNEDSGLEAKIARWFQKQLSMEPLSTKAKGA